MIIASKTQHSSEWFAARAGKVTASGVIHAIAPMLVKGERKGEESAARASYKAKIVAEIMTGGIVEGGYVSSYMEYGTAQEPLARMAYEEREGVFVEEVGFVIHSTIARAGASPDGLVNDDGLLEVKAPKTETHIRYTLAGKLPPEYEPQVMWQLACTGREWCDFMSWDDRLPKRHKMFCTRVYRNEERIAKMEEGVLKFLEECDDLIERMNAANPALAEAPHDDLNGEGLTDDDLNAECLGGAQ